jgi:chromosome segregation ATPase
VARELVSIIKGGVVIFERLDALEVRVRETLAELGQLRSLRDQLEDKLRAAEVKLAERDKQLELLQAEREEARTRVEAMLWAIEQAGVPEGGEPAATRRGGDNGQSRTGH